MASGASWNPEDDLPPQAEPGERRWTHPSEMGMAVRGSSDRRRSSVIATGVVLGGLGLLLSGVLLGSGNRVERASSASEPIHRVEQSMATVMIVEDGLASVHPGLILDDEGHVVVSGDWSDEPAEIWVRCADRSAVRATPVASDDEGDLTVLAMSEPVGLPPDLAPAQPIDGQEVITATATVDGIVTVTDTIGAHAELSGDGEVRWLFDGAGRLIGNTAAQSSDDDDQIRRGRTIVTAARRLVMAAD